jgi:F0F1-type ATP synthase assembly protein I
MARSAPSQDTPASKQGRIRQIWAVFRMTSKADPIVPWLMLLALVGAIAAGLLIGVLVDHPIYVTMLGTMTGLLLAVVIMGRRAERAAFSQLAGKPGVTSYALKGLRRGWVVEEAPVAMDPRTQDLVFRVIGRPGVVLVTEGPVPRVNKLVDGERRRMSRVMPDVPVTVVNAGDEKGQVSLRKLSRTIAKAKPVLTKGEVGEVAKRLRALGALRPPIPKGVDPARVRPDRRATRGR